MSYPRIIANGSPGTRVYNGVVGECNSVEHSRIYAVLPALWKMDLERLRFGENGGLRKRVLESTQLKDTIRAIDSDYYDSHRESKDSVDQGSSAPLRLGSL